LALQAGANSGNKNILPLTKENDKKRKKRTPENVRNCG
jgi:hypothetical protein